MVELPKPKKKLRSRVLLGCVVLLCLSLAGVFVFLKRAPSTPEEIYALGNKMMAKGDPGRAFNLFKDSAAKRPGEAGFLKATAQAASRMGDAAAARRYARYAWDKGIKDAETFRLLISGIDVSRPAAQEKNVRQAEAWFQELPPGERSLELEADFLYHFGKKEEAVDLWEKALEARVQPALIAKLAQIYLIESQPEKALQLLESHQRNGGLDEKGERLLVNLKIMTGEFAEAERLMRAWAAQHPVSPAFQIDRAVFDLIRQRFSKAQSLLEPLAQPAQRGDRNNVRHQAQILLAYIYFQQENQEGLRQLRNALDENRPSQWLEGQRYFLQALDLIPAQKEQALGLLFKARRLMPDQGVVELVTAQVLTDLNRFQEAADSYREVGGVMTRTPQWLFGFARALHGLGRDREAMQQLSQLHRQGVYAKPTLELMRDLAFQAKETEMGRRTQQFLDEQFAEEPPAGALVEPETVRRWAARQWETGEVKPVLAGLKQRQLPLGHWVKLAEAAEQRNLTEAAAYCYGRALELKSDNPALLNNWAWNEMQQPDFNETEVLEACRKALAKLPENPDVLDTYAEALWRAGRYQECKNLLEQNRSLTSDHSRLLCFLGQSYELSQQTAEALTVYRQCREQHRRDGRNLPLSQDQLLDRIQQLQTRLN